MIHSRAITFFTRAAAIPLAAVALAGCAGGRNATSSQGPTKPAGASTATVRAADTSLGKVLVDSTGRTLYLFEKDAGTRSTCTGACAAAWPPLRSTGKPTAGGDARASMIGTIARSDGAPEVTYDGHPLYRYQGDRRPGDTNGEGLTAFGAAWHALTPTGQTLHDRASTSHGGGGY